VTKLSEEDFEKTYLVYKFIQTPLTAMQVGLKSLINTQRA